MKKPHIVNYQYILFAILLLYITPSNIFAQYKTSQYTHQNGLDLSHIEHIAQDSLGYIWIGARNGLARFDGVKFNHYYTDHNNPNSLPFSDISNLVCDPKGNLWVGSHEGGIAIYNNKKGGFLRIDLEGKSFLKKPMTHLSFNDEGIGFASFMSDVLYRLELRDDSLRIDIIQEKNITYLNIQNWPLKPNHLLLSTSKGLYTFDTESFEMDTLYPSLQWYNSLYTNGKVYGYNYFKNVHVFDVETKIVSHLDDKFENRRKDILNIGNEIWVTNGNQGVIRFNEKNELLETFPLIPLTDTKRNTGENAYVLFEDRDKGIWIGRDSDVLYLNRKKEGIKSYPTYTNKFETTYDALTIKSDVLLLATVYENHLLEYNTSTKESRPIYSKDKFNNPFSIHIIEQDTLIIYSHGIGKYTQKSNRINSFLNSEYASKIKKYLLYDIINGSDSDLWILDTRYRLIHLLPGGIFEVKTILKDIPPNHFARTIMRYDEDIFIIGGSASIAIYSLSKGLINYILLEDTELKRAINDILLDTTNEGKKTLWISSYANILFKAELRNNELIFLDKYSMKEGLLNSRPGDLILTKEGNLIISSSIGLAQYNADVDRFVPFNDENELLGSNIVNIKEIDDQIYVFQDEGFSTINKQAFNKKDKPPDLFIEKMTVNSIAVDYQIDSTTPIKLKNNQKNVSLHFSALNYSFPQDVLYAYKLNDNDSWAEVNYLEKVARFNHLASGDYKFKVKARTSNSGWSGEKIIRFYISPPFWKSWYFLLLLTLLFAAIVYGYIKWREQNINKISSYEKKLIELEGEALRAQMNPHFIFNSLNSIKAFIIRNEPESAADYLTLFADLIRVVLHNSKQKMIPLSAEIEAVDLYTQLENIRLNNKFELIWNIDETLDLYSILIPPLTLQPFVENAIWHGFIHKKTKGKLEISLFIKKENLIATIKDDGIGRAKSMVIEGKKKGSKKSYGIAITSQRLDQNQGKERIKIIDLYDQNNEAIGTEVELTIDLVKSPKS